MRSTFMAYNNAMRNKRKLLLVSLFFTFLFTFWISRGMSSFDINVDNARDLNALSNLWIHRIVWLGPQFSVGFPASPLYFYLLFPGLLLTGGSAYSLVFSQVVFAIGALGLILLEKKNKHLVPNLILVLMLGLSPWFIQVVTKPWNGHQYVIWLLGSLVLLHVKKMNFLSALFLGIAISIHPAALCGLPILLFEWCKSPHKRNNFLLLLLGLLLPWIPIILFEIITEGFLTRQWLSLDAKTGISFSYSGITNILTIIQQISLPQIILVISTAFAIFLGTNRDRVWLLLAGATILCLVFVSNVLSYYLLGFTCLFSFAIGKALSKRKLGQLLLVFWLISYLLIIKGLGTNTYTPNSRTVERLQTTVNETIKMNQLTTKEKIALVSVIDKNNSTPQADDYRFFFRIAGFDAVDISEYPQADKLIIFFEKNDIDWEEWQDWQSDTFGEKQLISNEMINGTRTLVYTRK